MVREHASLLGDHFVEEIYEIAGDVSPADFPLIDDPLAGRPSSTVTPVRGGRTPER